MNYRRWNEHCIITTGIIFIFFFYFRGVFAQYMLIYITNSFSPCRSMSRFNVFLLLRLSKNNVNTIRTGLKTGLTSEQGLPRGPKQA